MSAAHQPEPVFERTESHGGPCCSVLARLQAFLPAMATANEELERFPPPRAADPAPAEEGEPELLDPQLLGDADGPYIEMVRTAL